MLNTPTLLSIFRILLVPLLVVVLLTKFEGKEYVVRDGDVIYFRVGV